MQIRIISLFFLLCLTATNISAQSQTEVPEPNIDDKSVQAIRLDELARLLQKKTEQRLKLEKSLTGSADDLPADKQLTLNNLNRDIGNLSATFEMIALSNTDTALLDGPDTAKTDWRQDLLDILNPLIESLKSITKRPRQVAEARDTVYRSEARLQSLIKQSVNWKPFQLSHWMRMQPVELPVCSPSGRMNRRNTSNNASSHRRSLND